MGRPGIYGLSGGFNRWVCHFSFPNVGFIIEAEFLALLGYFINFVDSQFHCNFSAIGYLVEVFDNFCSEIFRFVQMLSRWPPFLWVACVESSAGVKLKLFVRKSEFFIPILLRLPATTTFESLSFKKILKKAVF